MKDKRVTLIPASHLILINKDKILLLKRSNTGYQDGNYGLVAGHLNGEETLLETIVREAMEEAGIQLKIEDLEVVHLIHEKDVKDERINFFILAHNWEGEPKNMEPHKCDELSWFDINNLPKNMIELVEQAIKNIRNKIFYSEFGW